MNCRRPKVPSIDAASALARLVLPTPGTSSMSRWPSETRHSSTSSITSGLPWMTRSMFSRTAPWWSAKVSRTAVWRVANGMLLETWRGRDRVGRGPISLTPRPVDRFPAVDSVLAVDVGGTKMAAGVVDRRRRRCWLGAHGPRPRETTRRQVFAALLDAVDEVRRGDEIACGVGSGGPMTRGGESVSPLNIPGWRGFPLRARLAEALGLPVHVDNDAKALALGEGWRGAAPGERDYIAMVVSTGVGGGIVLDGRLLDGEDGNAGHIGHVIVEPDGRAVPVRRAGLPRGRGERHRHRGAHRRAGGGGARRGAGTRRPPGRPGRRVGRRRCSTCASRSSPARSRSATATSFFDAAQAGARRARPPRVRPRRPHRPGRARRRGSAGRRGRRRAAGDRARSRRRLTDHYPRPHGSHLSGRGRGVPGEGAGVPRRAPAAGLEGDRRADPRGGGGVHDAVAERAARPPLPRDVVARRSTAGPGSPRSSR